MKRNQNLKKALKSRDKKITIESRFELSSSSKPAIERAVGEIIKHGNNFKCKLSSELISGTEIDTESYRLSRILNLTQGVLKYIIMKKEIQPQSQ